MLQEFTATWQNIQMDSLLLSNQNHFQNRQIIFQDFPRTFEALDMQLLNSSGLKDPRCPESLPGRPRRYQSVAARRTAARWANAGSATSSAYVVAEHRLSVLTSSCLQHAKRHCHSVAVTPTVGTQTKPLDSEVNRCDGSVQFCKGNKGVLLSEDEAPISVVGFLVRRQFSCTVRSPSSFFCYVMVRRQQGGLRQPHSRARNYTNN